MAIDKLTLDDLIAVNEEIAALVRAGVPLERGLASIAAELPSRPGRLAARLAERTEQGATLTEAIEAEGDRLPAAYVAVVAAGLRSGRLDAAVQGLVDTARRMADLRRVTGLALAYPLIIVIAAWVLMGVALVAILPHIGDLSVPQSATVSRTPSAWTVGLVAMLVILGLVTIGLAVAWRRAGRADALGRSGRAAAFGRGVSFRRVRRLSQAAAFADFLALLIEHNVPLPEALELSARAAGARSLARQVTALAADVRAGRRAADAREQLGAFPALIRLALLNDRDESGMSAGLRAAAETYRHRADQDADWLMLRTPVVLTLLLGGGTVAAYAALVLAPYISVLHSMTDWL
jgi:type II secretory pathway component PulF